MASKQVCGLCGRDPAAGYAMVDTVRYCHGDFDPDPTCYMKAQSRMGLGSCAVSWDFSQWSVTPNTGKEQE